MKTEGSRLNLRQNINIDIISVNSKYMKRVHYNVNFYTYHNLLKYDQMMDFQCLEAILFSHPQDYFYLTHPMGKIKNRQLHAGRTSIRNAIVMLK